MTSRSHSHCTTLWEKGISLNLFIRCAGLGHLHTSPLPETASTSTLGSQEPGLMAAFPLGREPVNSLSVKVLWAVQDPDSAYNGI